MTVVYSAGRTKHVIRPSGIQQTNDRRITFGKIDNSSWTMKLFACLTNFYRREKSRKEIRFDQILLKNNFFLNFCMKNTLYISRPFHKIRIIEFVNRTQFYCLSYNCVVYSSWNCPGNDMQKNKKQNEKSKINLKASQPIMVSQFLQYFPLPPLSSYSLFAFSSIRLFLLYGSDQNLLCEWGKNK